jgi:hypothetical protein
MATHVSMERRLRIAGVLVLLGLLVEAGGLCLADPAAFLVFAFIGIPIASLGILFYLWSLISLRSAVDTDELRGN